MCFSFHYPSGVGYRLGNLKPGDQITILKGEGYPAAQEEKSVIIWKVAGYSALCTDGTRLSCQNLSDFVETGTHFEEFLVSDEAKEIWKSVLENQDSEEPEAEPE